MRRLPIVAGVGDSVARSARAHVRAPRPGVPDRAVFAVVARPACSLAYCLHASPTTGQHMPGVPQGAAVGQARRRYGARPIPVRGGGA